MPLNVTLRPFQDKAVAQYRQAWTKGTSHIGIAPTAFGKTIMIGWLASKLCPTGWRVVSIAHRENLVEQNADKVRRVDPDLLVAKEIAGERVPDATGVDVISASIATLRGKRAIECAKAWRADGRKVLLIVDEAHHCLAKSYRDWIDLLKPDRLLGLTATPFRGDGESLRCVFPEVGFDISRGEMVDDGWLARPHLFTVTTHTSLRDVKTRAGDYVEGDLAKVIDNTDRNQLVLSAANEAADMLATYHNQKVARGVCFTVSVEHAHSMAALFAADGWEAYAIDGSTPIPERRHADERLRHGEGKVVLCSCGVLTEGWDVEEVNLGLFARPTKSGVLAEQMMGRVLRYLEGKPTVLLVDFQDQWAEGRMTLAKPWHLPEQWDCQGEDVRMDELWFHGKIAGANISTQSEMWACTSRAEVEALLGDTSARKGRTLDRTYLWWDLGEEVRMSINTGSVVVFRAPQGDYVAEWRRGQEVCHIGTDMALGSVCDNAEMWIDQYHPDDARFLRGREKWQAPSEKQVAYMKRQGITVPEGMTKYQASQLINERRMQQNKSTEGGYITFGKYNGFHVTEIPSHYIRWMLAPEREGLKHRPEYAMFQNEMKRRTGGVAPIEVGGANTYWQGSEDYSGHDDS
jgi:superfamily II DNA or RNA helicase